MKTVTASGLTIAGAGLLGSSVLGVATEAFAQSGVTDVDIINFALNLEYMFEGLFQPMHLDRDSGNRVITIWSQQACRSGKRHGRRHPRI